MLQIPNSGIGEFRTHRPFVPIENWCGVSVDDGLYGVAGGSLVLAAEDWRPAKAIGVGDRIWTFDHGLKPVVTVTHVEYTSPGPSAPDYMNPIFVPAHAIGNTQPTVLLPEEVVMCECDAAERLIGDPFVLLPAAALVGFHGIHRVAELPPFEIVTLHFEKDEVIFLNGDLLVYSPAPVLGDTTLDFLEPEAHRAEYSVMHLSDARKIVASMDMDDNAVLFRNPDFGVVGNRSGKMRVEGGT